MHEGDGYGIVSHLATARDVNIILRGLAGLCEWTGNSLVECWVWQIRGSSDGGGDIGAVWKPWVNASAVEMIQWWILLLSIIEVMARCTNDALHCHSIHLALMSLFAQRPNKSCCFSCPQFHFLCTDSWEQIFPIICYLFKCFRIVYFEMLFYFLFNIEFLLFIN